MSIAAGIAAALAGIGMAQAGVGAILVSRFAKWSTGPAAPELQPPITILKPLYGDEPLLEQALTSLCVQDYPEFQIVFGVQDPTDAALPVVARLQARFPRCDIAVVVNSTPHGTNRKVGNLINMLPSAKHDVLAIADLDLHVAPDYLTRLAETLTEPNTGLVTTLYAGLPAEQCLAALLGTVQITHNFMPGALLARAMGRQDCLGATMLLRRETLTRIGGLHALVEHLADDQVLGRLVQGTGLLVRLAPTLPATTVPETDLSALWRHELRWARTIRALVPAAFAASVLQYPLFWAALAIMLSDGAIWSWGLFILAWVARAFANLAIDRALEPMLCGTEVRAGGGLPPHFRAGGVLPAGDTAAQGLAFAAPVWLLPLRDLMSVGVMLASYAGRRVDWRGHRMVADTPARVVPGPAASQGTAPKISKELRPR